MGAGHGHGLGEGRPVTAAQAHRRRMVAVLAIIVVILTVEVVGAVLSGSLALFADAGHMLADGFGVALALLATVIAARPATARTTFGLQRAEILAALTNGVVVAVIGGFAIVGGVRRLIDPGEVDSGLMLLVAVVGLLGNLAALLLLRSGQRDSLNVRGAYLEVLGDTLGSVAVVGAAVVIMTTGYLRADAVASILIGLMILPRAWSLLRDVVTVLLEATPKGVDLEDVRQHLLEAPGVVDVHDLHAWTITSGVPVLSAHVVVTDTAAADCGTGAVLDGLHECLAGHFDIEHSTFQIEPEGHVEHEHASHA
ncbi:cobalt-zinc-cadmium efflux system protein [Haloactinopolyspora alba]|uniref:Cobalt-zinc-cadmium efflux system protein n=1 Tax=Haloactinopolyspora alba TaxID=648780 RepID=A0A2P8DJ62_9ACTN|nr:cation diffusion facilitator family transporter [Haloactinopolyspora alba]PSK97228.1 cobalt-zinc-cadmium efflux system protein [Haloactinopolyspora alba]